MFVGHYRHTLDSKNRLVIPAKFRPFITRDRSKQPGLFVTQLTTPHGPILQMYPIEAWQKRVQWVEGAARRDAEAEWFLRKFSWDAEYCCPDSQWRLILPARLVEQAQLGREVVIAGVIRWMEVWDARLWERVDRQIGTLSPVLGRHVYQPAADAPQGSKRE
jgi:MraZ protein